MKTSLKKQLYLALKVASLFIILSTSSFAVTDSLAAENGVFPLAKTWFVENNIPLPVPFGVGTFFTHMKRDVDITNVDVALPNNDKQSINDFAEFDLTNKTTVAAVKLDIWVLPLLNLYGLVGAVTTNADLEATITIDKIILPGPPTVISINNNSDITGNYFGLGSTVVGGYKNWFLLGDVSYGYSKFKEFDGKLDFWMYSARTGLQSQIGNHNLRSWVGAIYLSSDKSLHFNAEDEDGNAVTVDVYQHTKNPLTFQTGSMLTVYKRFEIMGEIGTNFDDASLAVFAFTYRF